MNSCGVAINLVATTDEVELISLDFLYLNIKKAEYGHAEVSRERLRWLLAEAML